MMVSTDSVDPRPTRQRRILARQVRAKRAAARAREESALRMAVLLRSTSFRNHGR